MNTTGVVQAHTTSKLDRPSPVLSVQVRFGVPAAVFTFFGAAIQGIVGSLAAPTSATAGGSAALRECVRYGVQQAGNPLAVFFQTAAALISIAVVWPWHGAGNEPPLWDHLQRFCWTEEQIDETAAARNAASTRPEMSKVSARCTHHHIMSWAFTLIKRRACRFLRHARL